MGVVEYGVSGGVATITLNRPEVLNALNRETDAALLEALRRASSDVSVRAVVLRGAGRAFSAGQDLGEFREAFEKGVKPDYRGVLLRRKEIIMAIRELEKPVVAGINGAVAGIAISLALACDLRVASSTARFVMGFGRIGLVPDGGLTYLMPRLIGYGRFAELYFSNREVSAEEARTLGLVDYVFPQERFDEELTNVARKLASEPTKAYALFKKSINHNVLPELARAIELEAELQEQAGATQDHREGVMAFLQKRKPEFKGL